MTSRYDLMLESSEIDPNDKQAYPDPLSVDFENFVFKEPPFIIEPTDQMASRPYLITYAIYKKAEYDDIILNINNVPHLSKIFDSDIIRYPTDTDLMEFLKKVL